MSEDSEQIPPAADVEKTLEAARLIFRVETSMTVVEVNGRRMLRFAGASAGSASDIDAQQLEEPLTEALNGLLRDIAGEGLGVVQVHARTAGSIEIVAIVVATYLAVKQGVEVVETLQKVAELGRRLVQAVLRARPMPVDWVHGRVELSSSMDFVGRRSDMTGNRSATAAGGFLSLAPINRNGLLLLVILNLLVASMVLAVVLIR